MNKFLLDLICMAKMDNKVILIKVKQVKNNSNSNNQIMVINPNNNNTINKHKHKVVTNKRLLHNNSMVVDNSNSFNNLQHKEVINLIHINNSNNNSQVVGNGINNKTPIKIHTSNNKIHINNNKIHISNNSINSINNLNGINKDHLKCSIQTCHKWDICLNNNNNVALHQCKLNMSFQQMYHELNQWVQRDGKIHQRM